MQGVPFDHGRVAGCRDVIKSFYFLRLGALRCGAVRCGAVRCGACGIRGCDGAVWCLALYQWQCGMCGIGSWQATRCLGRWQPSMDMGRSAEPWAGRWPLAAARCTIWRLRFCCL